MIPGAATAQAWPALRDELRLNSAGTNRDGSPAWHLADPVRNLFFRLGWLEIEILKRWQLADVGKIAQAINQQTTLNVDEEDIKAFVLFLQQQQLLRSARYRPASSAWKWLLHSYLFIRIPLVHPEKALRKALPWLKPLFSKTFMWLTLFVAITGIVLAARQWDTVVATLHNSVNWHGAVAFAIALVFSKCWHEMGHALTATRHGVRVGHMGVALLVMLPMAYTDTGESWKLIRSRDRLKIAVAGIASELVLAAWATLLWSFAPEGSVKNALFFLATTAWVMTVVVNASPFMRFDGYYILSDMLDFPGLHERAGNWAKRAMRWHLFGINDPKPDNVTPAFARFLTVFAFATWIYRLLLFIGIAVVIYHAFFKALGVILFLIEIVTFVVQPMIREIKHCWARRAESQPFQRRRLLLIAIAALLVIFVPWSNKVNLPGVIEAGFVQPIYTPYSARLEKILVTDGQEVKAGQPLFELIAPLPETSQRKAEEMRRAWEFSARGALGLDKDGPAKQVLAEQMARQYSLQQSAGNNELLRLRLVAASSGRIEDSDISLQPGSWVSPSTHIATLVNADRWRVKALVGEEDLGRLRVGAQAKIYQHDEWQPLIGRVVSIDHNVVTRLPSLLLAKDHGGPVQLNPTAQAKDLRPQGVWYRVSIEGDGKAAALNRENLADISVESKRQSLAHRWFNSVSLMLIQQTGMGKDG